MNTAWLFERDTEIRVANLAVFIALATGFIVTDQSVAILLVLVLQSGMNLISQVVLSIKYQNYNVGPITTPFIGSELAGFTIVTLLLMYVPLPFSLQINILLGVLLGVSAFIISVPLLYIWFISGLFTLGIAAYYVDEVPYASAVGILSAGSIISITYANQKIVNVVGQRFISTSGLEEIDIGESPLEEELVYGKELSETTDSVWYCKIPLDESAWFTLKGDRREDLKKILDSDLTETTYNSDIPCAVCGSEYGIMNISYGVQCEQESALYASASKSQICHSCSQDAFRKILTDGSIDTFNSEDYLSSQI